MRLLALAASVVGLFCIVAGTDAKAANPGFPDGNYTFRESWTYTKTYSGSSSIRIRTEKDGRLVAVNRRNGRNYWLLYPKGKGLVAWRENNGQPSFWTGRWKRTKNSLVFTARSGVQSGTMTFQRLNSSEWKMTGVHKVRGKQIGVGRGTLKRLP